MTESFFDGLGYEDCLYCGARLPDTFDVEENIGPDSRLDVVEHSFNCPGCGETLFFYALTGATFTIPHDEIADNALDEQGRPSPHETSLYSMFHFAFADGKYILAGKRDGKPICSDKEDVEKLLDITEGYRND